MLSISIVLVLLAIATIASRLIPVILALLPLRIKGEEIQLRLLDRPYQRIYFTLRTVLGCFVIGLILFLFFAVPLAFSEVNSVVLAAASSLAIMFVLLVLIWSRRIQTRVTKNIKKSLSFDSIAFILAMDLLAILLITIIVVFIGIFAFFIQRR